MIENKLKNKFPFNSKQKGAAMLISVIFFLFIFLVITTGLVSSSTRLLGNASMNLKAKASYFLAESGVEDVIYRTMHDMPISGNEVIAVGLNSVNTTVTDNDAWQKNVSSLGDFFDSQRKVDLTLNIGDGLSFSYGIQVGSGGLVMGDDTIINGSVYSDGPIIGETNSKIIGSVISANGSSIIADQQNGSGTPVYNLVFSRQNSSEDIAQSFTVSSSGSLNKADIYLKKTGNPSNLTFRVVHDDGGKPNGNTQLASGTLSSSLVSTSYGWVTATFDFNPKLATGITYWLVIDGGNESTSNFYTIGADTSYSNGIAKIGNFGEQSWSSPSQENADLFFKVYLQGISGTINRVIVGENGVGNAYAHTVKNSYIAGTNYCQTGSNNNKNCDTSLPDPTSVAMPISEQNIQDWKDDALTGGIISGNYIPGGNNVSLGPKKIEGNLILTGIDVLTLTGNLWVTGDFKVDYGAIVQPSSSYGNSSVAIIVDGRIVVRNGAEFNSGNSNSYVLALTTSDCPFDPSCNGRDAVELASEVDAVILYAPNGVIDVESQAKAKQLTAYGISLGIGSELIYDSGLINQNFIGGPSGGWNSDGWGESE